MPDIGQLLSSKSIKGNHFFKKDDIDLHIDDEGFEGILQEIKSSLEQEALTSEGINVSELPINLIDPENTDMIEENSSEEDMNYYIHPHPNSYIWLNPLIQEQSDSQVDEGIISMGEKLSEGYIPNPILEEMSGEDQNSIMLGEPQGLEDEIVPPNTLAKLVEENVITIKESISDLQIDLNVEVDAISKEGSKGQNTLLYKSEDNEPDPIDDKGVLDDDKGLLDDKVKISTLRDKNQEPMVETMKSKRLSNFIDDPGADLPIASKKINTEESQVSNGFRLLDKDNNEMTLDFTEALKENHGIEQANMVREIVDKAIMTLDQGGREMEIQIKPDHLGKITLKVILDNGVFTGKIYTTNEQIREFVQRNLDDLRISLEGQGLIFTSLDVDVGSQQNPN
ncbi:MAG TPA: flagellar hook-length control protein FliK, partial [Clostridia bacterium]|nr:flagellar hook-length control protein FliK [Clostridia bacterium]